ncbi:threonine/serine dehydratase [Aquincola sp. S2]|uniref:Threonine/serine dehydratase n=1 Tax=Pseudaquabacterium terrae TaxID=2732868 RepID=A0ABX2EL79_9BURK|nr:threonine/serine dehydratase [Aquabacterium terrae]NRF69322.1 threonine/serine dehydratase [Aquabacterium terrae]
MQALMQDAAAASFTAYPSLDELRATAARLQGRVLRTPVWRWQTGVVAERLAPATEVWLKLELLQRSGSFKLRGALNNVAVLDDAARARGVTAASAGNHAMAVALAAQAAGTPAKVAMPRHASPARMAACRAAGAEVLLFDTIHDAFAAARALVESEGRTMIHPFDGPLTAAGTGTVGLELMEQVAGLDAVVVPVGGGGLAGGIAAAVKQLNPRCEVFGVEPLGADAMARSFDAGAPVTLERVDTVADSLGAPYAMDYSFGVCRRFVDEVVRVSDDALCQALHWLFRDMKLAVEPAGAAATAALFGPLRERLDGRKVALIVCGANLDADTFARLLARGAALDQSA